LGGGLDPDVVEAAALAHDLDHPPFGHIAEQELQTILQSRPVHSFEGNAQSFRIITKVAVHGDRTPEHWLNLTRATLRAVLKYPWFKGANPAYPLKWGAYLSEESDFRFAMSGSPLFPKAWRRS
jgi:dGTPase